jgi:hypothetical protein
MENPNALPQILRFFMIQPSGHFPDNLLSGLVETRFFIYGFHKVFLNSKA